MANVKTYTDEHGFECLEVHTSEGGRVILTDFKPESGKAIHIYNSLMNPHGLGYSKNMYTNEDIDKTIKEMQQTIWLEDNEKESCIHFLEKRKIEM